MSLNAAEMGLSESDFWRLSFVEYVWKWHGYLRKIERQQFQSAREIVSVIYNSNVKKGKGKTAKRLWPLAIDPIRRELTQEERTKVFDSIPAGWWGDKLKRN